LALIAGLVLTLTAQFAAAEQLLADAAPALSAPDVPADVRGQLAGLRATLARFQGDAAGSLAYAQQALSQLAPDNSASRAGAFLNIGVAAMAHDDNATAQAALAEAAALAERADIQWIAVAAIEELMSLQGRQGNLQQVFQTAAKAAQVSARLGGQAFPSAGMGLVGTAEVLYERNDLAGAAQASAAAADLLRASVERLLLVRGYVTLAQVCQARGDHDGALSSIQQCETWFAQNAIVAGGSAQAWLAAHRARLWVRQGDLAAAAGWAQGCVFVENSELGYVQRLTLARVRLAQRQNDRAGPLLAEASVALEQMLRAVEARGWTRYLIEGLVLQALVYQRQADLRNARRALHRALHLAAPQGYVRIFVDEGEPMAALLRTADQHTVEPAYVQRLLAAFPNQDKETKRQGDNETTRASIAPVSQSYGLPVSQPPVEPLSNRELEVLRLIADGHSNQAIADTLVVAVSTVKRHINNIYGKLAVQSRTQALVRARALHLL
jgi:LuxR family maltose regulon positive regulatory protein